MRPHHRTPSPLLTANASTVVGVDPKCQADAQTSSPLLVKIASAAMDIRKLITTTIQTITISDIPNSDDHKTNNGVVLRNCQRAYMGASNARRLFRRSVHCARGPHDEAIFTEHAANKIRFADMEPASPTRTNYSVECTTGVELTRQLESLESERKVLLKSINSARMLEGVGVLLIDRNLCERIQQYADLLDILDFRDTLHRQSPQQIPATPPTIVTTTSALSVRLMSPPGLGALACGEMWYGGKYRRHTCSAPSMERSHAAECPCHLRMVFETVVDVRWRTVGIGRSADGRWVVELVGIPKIGGDWKALPALPVDRVEELEDEIKVDYGTGH